MHRLNAGQQDPCARPGFEAEHRSGHSFDRTMVLLDGVVRVLALTQVDLGYVVDIVAVDRHSIRAALVDRDRRGSAVLIDCPREETTRRFVAAGGQWKINRATTPSPRCSSVSRGLGQHRKDL
jgi:hypothetical protein